jgi:hypothetical protein
VVKRVNEQRSATTRLGTATARKQSDRLNLTVEQATVKEVRDLLSKSNMHQKEMQQEYTMMYFRNQQSKKASHPQASFYTGQNLSSKIAKEHS